MVKDTGFDKSEEESEGQQRANSGDSANRNLPMLTRKLRHFLEMNKRDIAIALAIAVALAAVYVLTILQHPLLPIG